MSRQERRVRLKEAVKTVAKTGIDLDAPPAEQWRAIAALTRILLDILSTKSLVRASDAAKRAHDFFETSLAHNPSDFKIECAKGCHFCCHLRVVAMAPEVFLVANHIRREQKDALGHILERQRAADSLSRGLSARARARVQFHCGLLVDKACSVYAARPSACRGLTSISVRTCERGYNGEAIDVSTPAVWMEIRHAHDLALKAALTAARLPAFSYEFNHAVLVALEDPQAERRWLNGEDVFAQVSADDIGDDDKAIIARLTAGAAGKEMA